MFDFMLTNENMFDIIRTTRTNVPNVDSNTYNMKTEEYMEDK